MGKATRLRFKLDETLTAAFAHHFEEDITWDWVLIPTDQGVQVLVTMWCKGTIIGTEINHYFTAAVPLLVQQEIADEAVRKGIEDMLTQRAEFARTAAAEAATNGQGLTGPEIPS